MQHFANFGIIKKANKLKRQSHDEFADALPELKKAGLPKETSNNFKRETRMERKSWDSETSAKRFTPVIAGKANTEYRPVQLIEKYGNEARTKIKNHNLKRFDEAVQGVKDPKRAKQRALMLEGYRNYVPNYSLSSPENMQKKISGDLNYKRRWNKEVSEGSDIPLKPIYMKKDNSFDFKPTQNQLQDVYNKNYAIDDSNNHKYNKKLLTGSANHTWLTADGDWSEVPLSRKNNMGSESPLSADMWKDKYGNRLPKAEIQRAGELGSPKDGVSIRQAFGIDNRKVPSVSLRAQLINSNDRYNGEVYNNRWVPEE